MIMNLNRNSNIVNEHNVFENVCEMASILSRLNELISDGIEPLSYDFISELLQSFKHASKIHDIYR